LDVVKDMIVIGEVVAWDDIYASILLYLPVLLSKTLALGEQIFL
jgi:hypothetical protein